MLMWNREPVGGPFALIDHDGTPRTDADFRGKLMLIYFGFTYCSDVCPTDLQSIARRDGQARPGGRVPCSRCSSPSIRRRTRRNSSRTTSGCFIRGWSA